MSDQMFLKIHCSPGTGSVVSVCDGDLLNTTITDGELEVRITESFYGNSRASEAQVREALTNAENANLMGERAVGIAIELGLVSRENCIMIGTIPHAQIFRL
jgi:uncharacterized protein